MVTRLRSLIFRNFYAAHNLYETQIKFNFFLQHIHGDFHFNFTLQFGLAINEKSLEIIYFMYIPESFGYKSIKEHYNVLSEHM